MKESDLRAWNSNTNEMVVTTSHIGEWFNNDEYEILRFCDCEDAEGDRIFESDLLEFDEDNQETKREVVWNDRSLQWEVWIYGLTFTIGEGNQEVWTNETSLLESIPLCDINSSSLVIGNIYQGSFKYGYDETTN